MIRRGTVETPVLPSTPAPATSPATADTLLDGAVKLAQPARGTGYRVNADALLLARFAGEERAASVAWDLGAGVGAIALCLLQAGATAAAVLIERNAEAARLAGENLAANGFAALATVRQADVAELTDTGVADLVVCNPPYTAPGRGRAGAVPARQDARAGELVPFVAAARRLLARRGRACFVYPCSELVTLLAVLRSHGLEPKRLRLVQARAELEARVALVEAKPAKAGGLVVQPPWYDAPRDAP